MSTVTMLSSRAQIRIYTISLLVAAALALLLTIGPGRHWPGQLLMRVSAGAHPQSEPGYLTDIYVAVHGDDRNPGTQALPVRTFKAADALAGPGSTIHVAPGDYLGQTTQETITINSSGTPSARIRWVSDYKWTARLIGHRNPANGLGWGIRIKGSYVDLVGFDVTSNANMGIWVLGTNVRVIRNHVHDVPGQPGCTSFGASGIEQGNYSGGNMEVIANVVHNIGAGGPGSCNKYHGIYLAAPGDRAVNNISYHNASKGIGTWHAATRNVISNNTVFNNDVGILIGAGDSPCDDNCSVDYTIVTNNIIADNKSVGFWQYVNAGPHNTYSNNLVFGSGKQDVLMEGPCSGALASCNSFVNAIHADPQFIKTTGNIFTGNYRVLRTSRARKAGTPLGAPPDDFDGNPRPAGTPPDLGAYQISD